MSKDMSRAERNLMLKHGAMIRALEVYTTQTGIDEKHHTLSSWMRREDGKWVIFAPAISTRVYDDRELEAFLNGLSAGVHNGGV